MPRTANVQVFQYSELSDAAKERARNWFREGMNLDYAETVIEDVVTCANLIGFTVTTRSAALLGDGTKQVECIFWFDFDAQGGSAGFEGTWRAVDVEPGKLVEYAPRDVELARIAGEFEAIAKLDPESSLTVVHSSDLEYTGCTLFSADFTDDMSEIQEEHGKARLINAARAFMDWIYSQLTKEYEYQTSDEVVAENIEANGYEFTEVGKRFIA